MTPSNKGADQFATAYIVAEDEAQANMLAEGLVERRLAACCNILPPIRSVYRWEGRIEQATEAALLAKIRRDDFDALCQYVCEHHSYDVPCITLWPLADGLPAYLNFISSETQK